MGKDKVRLFLNDDAVDLKTKAVRTSAIIQLQ